MPILRNSRNFKAYIVPLMGAPKVRMTNFRNGIVPNMGYVCHVVPLIWVRFFIIDVPQNGSVSESLTHNSGHRLAKSFPNFACRI